MFGLNIHEMLIVFFPSVIKIAAIVLIIVILWRFAKAFERIAGALETIAEK